jgi:methylated-DNA-[protein]-cysteine S-methyltransferase
VPRDNPTPRFDAVVATPIGPIGIAIAGEALERIAFLPPRRRPSTPSHPLAREVAAQLTHYFTDPHFAFDLPLTEHGTPFQSRVWAALRAIPRGETRSYGALATALTSGPRAIGGACRANPLVIVTPCHRVIAVNGGLGGFAGAVAGRPLATKRWLLEHEMAA